MEPGRRSSGGFGFYSSMVSGATKRRRNTKRNTNGPPANRNRREPYRGYFFGNNAVRRSETK